jgi:hypothetical protein
VNQINKTKLFQKLALFTWLVSSVLWLIRLFQVVFKPMILIHYLLESIIDIVIKLAAETNQVNWSNVDAEILNSRQQENLIF